MDHNEQDFANQDRARRVNNLARALYDKIKESQRECPREEIMVAMLFAAGQALHALGVDDVRSNDWREFLLGSLSRGLQAARSTSAPAMH